MPKCAVLVTPGARFDGQTKGYNIISIFPVRAGGCMPLRVGPWSYEEFDYLRLAKAMPARQFDKTIPRSAKYLGGLTQVRSERTGVQNRELPPITKGTESRPFGTCTTLDDWD
ncbi:hypothetical protein KM043_018344 [Ampulex compressa]|nr:hypothetical protein KM043_018344 [Ampulex compressa]